jgi:hypothetical protein
VEKQLSQIAYEEYTLNGTVALLHYKCCDLVARIGDHCTKGFYVKLLVRKKGTTLQKMMQYQ